MCFAAHLWSEEQLVEHRASVQCHCCRVEGARRAQLGEEAVSDWSIRELQPEPDRRNATGETAARLSGRSGTHLAGNDGECEEVAVCESQVPAEDLHGLHVWQGYRGVAETE